MNQKKNYSSYSFFITLLVVIILLVVSLVPPIELDSFRLKRANIISDIVKFKDSTTHQSPKIELDTSFLADLDTSIFSQALPEIEELEFETVSSAQLTENWQISSGSSSSHSHAVSSADSSSNIELSNQTKPTIAAGETVAIEDYAPLDDNMSKLYKVLGERKVRIAVLGDSFIECDIIVGDIRETLQDVYNGSGVGFVPFSSPISKYRNTVKHTFEGWTTHNVMQKKKSPEDVQNKFYISGMVCIPDQGATARFESTDFRKYLSESSVARIFFINRKNTELEVTVNDDLKRTFNPVSSDKVQQIVINADIRSLDIKINKADGFIGYGVLFEDREGVTVDNYSIRGNSGLAIFSTDYSINTQINKFLNYDLVILQYGLNAMSLDAKNYNSYSSQLVRLIAYVKKCFPRSAIMLMSVGDRCSSKDGVVSTLPNVHYMLDAQRLASEKGEVGFWNVFQAMGGENSMIDFVERKWAAKDYMHIGYGGGQFIGRQFAKALMGGADLLASQRRAEQQIKEQIRRDSLSKIDSLNTLTTINTADSVKNKLEADTINTNSQDTQIDSLLDLPPVLSPTDSLSQTNEETANEQQEEEEEEKLSGKSKREAKRAAKRNDK